MVKLIIDNVFTTAVSSNTTETAIIDACLRYTVKNHQSIKAAMKRKYPTSPYWKNWNGVKSFYDEKYNAFLTGLLGRVIQQLQACGVGYEIIDKRINPIVGARATEKILHGIKLHDYQLRAANEFLTVGRGVVKLPTGAGKTEIAIAATTALGPIPTMFLTHRVNLLHQTAKRFVERNPKLKSKIGIIGDGSYQPNLITLATVQTLQALMKANPEEFKSLMSYVQFLIIDEAHRAAADQFNRPAVLANNAYYRMALTATPFMNGSDMEDMLLTGITGPIATTVTNHELIERGIMARPFFKFYDIAGPDMRMFTKWSDIYERGITHNLERNKLIVKHMIDFSKAGKKTLVIVNHKSHGVNIMDLAKDTTVKAKYIDGGNAYSERDKALRWLEKSGDCLVVTNIFDEGVDCNAINAVILAAGNKSAPALMQRTGRAVRRKEEGNYAIVVDFIDRQHPKLLEHSAQRYNLIKNEKGFTIL